jgi:hypothetical protein
LKLPEMEGRGIKENDGGSEFNILQELINGTMYPPVKQ